MPWPRAVAPPHLPALNVADLLQGQPKEKFKEMCAVIRMFQGLG